MESYKLCPCCQKEYPASLVECEICGVELIKKTGEQVASMPKKNTLYRICDCGEKNPSNARKCVACGEDISYIFPRLLNDTENAVFQLVSLDNIEVVDITEEHKIFGKKYMLGSYLSSKRYVSREQCKIYVENQDVYIENLSKTNGTFVNNKRIETKTKLMVGNEVGFGGCCVNNQRQDGAAYFIIKRK